MEWAILPLFPSLAVILIALKGGAWPIALLVYGGSGVAIYRISERLGRGWARGAPAGLMVFALPNLLYWAWAGMNGIGLLNAYRPFLFGPFLGTFLSALTASFLGKSLPPLLAGVLSYGLFELYMRLRRRWRYSAVSLMRRRRDLPRRE